MDGIGEPGVQFHSTMLNLSVPAGYDVPTSFVFRNDTGSGLGEYYRVQLWVDGW